MRRPSPEPSWPESWKLSFHYDEMELYGASPKSGYATAYRTRRATTLRLVERVAKPGARVLDLAAGQGNLALTLAERGYRVTWNDLREDLVDYVKAKHERGDVQFAPGNAFDRTFDEAFDVVCACEVIEHVAHPDEFLQQVARLVRPGGHIILTTPNGGYFRNRLPRFSDCPDPSRFEAMQFRPDGDGHIFLLHVDELHDLARRAGLRVQRLELFNNTLSSGGLKTGALLPLLPTRFVGALERLTEALPGAVSQRLHTGMAAILAP